MKTKLALLVSLLLVLVLLVCSCGGATPDTPDGPGESTGYSQNLEFELNGDGNSYYLKGKGTCQDSHVIIPDTYNGLPVTAIGEAAFRYTEEVGDKFVLTTKVTVPDSITEIAPYAFASCDITSIELPGSVISVGDYAFSQCWYLSSVTFSEGTETLGSYVFNECAELESVTLPNSLKSIGESAFANLTKLASVTLGTSLEAIGNSAFAGCTALTEIEIPDSVTSLGEYAFSTCKELKSATVGDGVEAMVGTFYDCEKLETVKIGASVKSITNYALSTYTTLKTIDISNVALWCSEEFNLENLPYYDHEISLYVNGESAENLVIPDDVTSIRGYAFFYFDNIKFVTLPSALTSIGADAFRGCENLRSITLPKSLTSIGTGAFSGCYRLVEVCTLSSINWGSSYWSGSGIGEHALNIYAGTDGTAGTFATENGIEIFTYEKSSDTRKVVVGCDGTATSIEIPDDVNEIIPYAFLNCTHLESVKIPGKVEKIGENIFKGCTGIAEISIPYFADAKTPSAAMQSFQHIGYLFGACGYDYTYQGDYIPASLTSVEVLCNKIPEGAFYNCVNLTRVSIPSANSIGENAFYGCSKVSSLTVLGYSIAEKHFTPSNLVDLVVRGEASIPDGAYSNLSSLRSLTLSLTETIGAGAFANCTSLTSLAIPYASQIGDGAFGGCSLVELEAQPLSFAHFDKQSLESATIVTPASKDYIPANAFENCSNLKSVAIGRKIAVIGRAAFKNCTALTEVTLGSEVGRIDEFAFEGCTALESIVMPAYVHQIASRAFYNCTSLSSITFEDSKNWYMTEYDSDFANQRNGTATDVDDPSYFTDTYVDYYWYKLFED